MSSQPAHALPFISQRFEQAWPLYSDSNATLCITALCMQAVAAELSERAEVPSQLEVGSQNLVQFVSSGEAARIKARLTQIGRYWEELKESVQQLDGQLEESSSHLQKFKMSFKKVNGLNNTLTLPPR